MLDYDTIAEKVAGEMVVASISMEAGLSWDDLWRQVKTKLSLAKQPPTGDHYDAIIQALQKTTDATQAAGRKY